MDREATGNPGSQSSPFTEETAIGSFPTVTKKAHPRGPLGIQEGSR